MEKVYNHQGEENRCDAWDNHGLFKTENNSTDPAFSIIPPPIKGEEPGLGHALTFTIADIIIRRKKMQGFHCLWPTDPDSSESPFVKIPRRLGISMDRSRTRYHSSYEMQKWVARIFVQLYREGEIYRGLARSKQSESEPERPAPKQWFLKTSRIARSAGDAVKREKILFFPEKWKKEFLNWLGTIRDWGISSQSETGCRIPAFYCGNCNHLVVEEESPASCEKCGGTRITQESDGTATWFSAVLWPLAAAELQVNADDFTKVYPASLSTAGKDIFFSWTARMIMLGIHLRKEAPAREFLINGLIRDEKGQRMNTGKDNVPSLPEIIDTYGSDALRFTIALQAAPGMDVSLSAGRMKGSRAFVNKVWNAARYVLMNLRGTEDLNMDFTKITDADRWILNGLNNLTERLNDLMESYKISRAARLLYHFFRREYCDWYLEFSKKGIHNPHTRKTLKFTLFRLLQLLHPFMPFITEEIHEKMHPKEKPFLLQTEFPCFSSDLAFTTEFSHLELLKKIIIETRKTRTENGVHPNRKVAVFLKTESPKEQKMVEKNINYFNLLTRSTKTEIVNDFSALPRGFRGVCLNWEILLPLDSEEDRLNELTRLEKLIQKQDGRIANMENKLADETFTAEASEHAVSSLKKSLQESIDKRNKIRKTIDDLS